MELKSALSLKTVNKQLGVRISALRLGYASQSQYKIPYTLPIFSGLDETSCFSTFAMRDVSVYEFFLKKGRKIVKLNSSW